MDLFAHPKRWFLLGMGWAALGLPAALQGQTSPAPIHPPAAVEALRTRLKNHLDHARFEGAAWGVKIVSLRTGEVWFERDAGRLMSPASNSKLYVAALALDRLGGDARLQTRIRSTAPVEPSGDLPGDLVIEGQGDPDWNPRRQGKDFWSAFDPVVAVVRAAGVKRVTGDLVADATAFRVRPFGAGWTADDLNDYYGAEVSALTLDENYVDIRLIPGAKVGEPAGLDVLQPLSGLRFRSQVLTAQAGGRPTVVVQRLPGETDVHLWGEIPLGGAAVVTEATVPRPAQWYAEALRQALVRAGIPVEGRARSLRWPEASVAERAPVRLGEVPSAPVRDQVAVLMKASQNLRTNLLFAAVGERARRPDTPPWKTSESLAVEDLEAFLSAHGLRVEDVRFEDGSGLSRNNLTSAAALVSLLQFMSGHREADAFRASLPVAGVDGTLRRRMNGTMAEGKVLAKTGTLRWAQTLSGYLTTAAGEPLVFSLLLNRYRGSGSRTGRTELDELAVILAEFGLARAPVETR